jgi:hypothetical protein
MIVNFDLHFKYVLKKKVINYITEVNYLYP